MKKCKLLLALIAVMALFIMLPATASAEEATTGFVRLEDGSYEYYLDGEKLVDCEFWDEEYQAFFRVDEKGKMLSNQWYLDEEENWFFYKSGGYRADNESFKIGGVYYAFDNEGVMLDDCTAEIYIEKEELWCFVRAKAGGRLYVNEWYLAEDGTWYYYGEEGYTREGVITYSGNRYYIGWDGEMYADGEFGIHDEATDKTVWYRIKPNGVLYRNEWFKNEYGAKYYYTDNCSAAQGYVTVEGVNRFFYDDGYLCTDGIFYDEASGHTYAITVKGVANRLSANGWTLVGNKYFFCKEGQMLTDGVYEIGAASYYFYSDGIMLQNDYYDDYENGFRYRAGPSGALYRNQWFLDKERSWDEDNWEYYGDDFKAYDNGFYTIGNALYFFSDYIAVSDELIISDGVYVAAKSCGLTQYSNGWLRYDDEWYFVENDQLVINEIKQIGKFRYGFDEDGQMYADEYFGIEIYHEADDYFECIYYLAGESGAIIETPGLTGSGQYLYYVTEDGTLYTGEMELDGNRCIFSPYMYASTFDYLYEYNEETDTYDFYLYVVLPNGSYQKVTASGYYSTAYGKLLVENGKVFTGWKQAGANWFYFDPALISGTTYYIDDIMYYFDHSGKMAAGGWIDCGYTYKYADIYGKLADGLTNIGGSDYIFSDTDMVRNSLFYIDDFWYVTDDSGRAYKLAKEGWNQINDDFYYIQDGEVCFGETYLIENDKEVAYLFDYETGKMLTNYYDGTFYYGETGHRLEKGWVNYNGNYKYFDPYEYWWGVCEIDGVKYFFEYGKMLANTYYYDFSTQTIYAIAANGAITAEFDMTDGFSYEDGEARLVKNGIPYTGWHGSYYFKDGTMLINDVERIDGKVYYFTPKGTFLRGWYRDVDNTLIYADQSGAVTTNKWIQAGGKWYYAGAYGWCYSDGVEYIETEDRYALFTEDGVYVKYMDFDKKAPTGTPNTWGYIDGYWYYYTATGVAATNDTLYIGNSWYTFDYEGRMFANEFDGNGYYYQASGARLEAICEWKLINNKWLYFGANGNVNCGWITLNGTKYYIADKWDYSSSTGKETYDYTMYTGFHIIDDKVYQFSAAGACLGAYTTNGWVKLYDGSYAYIKDGKLLVNGIYNINGVDYCFDYSGYMLANDFYYSDPADKFVYASASGALYGNGWHSTEKGWIYIDANRGMYTNGVYLINGGLYFFNAGYWVS